ncbi:MAG: hypothetical protein M1318_03875, partial [Firmicutes bacterium]|nr:hypothetical protein [Bacillota bacterium]
MKYVFTAPDYPWHGVAGSELIHATFDPERARRWQQDASLNERANATLARFAKEGGPAPSLSHWAKWVAVWVSQEPEPRPYVTLTPSANVLARSIQQRPGTLWQRIREQFHWSSETVDDAHLLVQRIASGIRDVPFSTFYEWARIARWHEQHAHEPNGGSSFPNAWTDALAQQCIHDEDFWDKFPNADALVALDEWLTTNPLSTSPTLDKLLADYTHWLALQPNSHDPATYVPKVPAAEKEALKQAWVQEYEARPAVGRDLAWLARTRNLVPSLGQGADPLTFRSRMMTWLTTLVDEGEIVAHETDEAPWDTHYTLSSHTLSEIQSRRQEVTTDTKPLPTIDPQWSHLIDLWTTTFGSGLATLDRVLSLITNDSTLSKLLPRNPKNQRKFLRETLFPHLPPQDPPVIIERHYNRNTRHTFYRLVSAPFSEPHSPSIPSKPMPERSLEDSPGSSEFSMSEIEEFFAGWYRSFGERSVKIGQLMRKGQEQGWILPIATENHRNPNKPHPC